MSTDNLLPADALGYRYGAFNTFCSFCLFLHRSLRRTKSLLLVFLRPQRTVERTSHKMEPFSHCGDTSSIAFPLKNKSQLLVVKSWPVFAKLEVGSWKLAVGSCVSTSKVSTGVGGNNNADNACSSKSCFAKVVRGNPARDSMHGCHASYSIPTNQKVKQDLCTRI